MHRFVYRAWALFLVLSLAGAARLNACTGIRLQAHDGAMVYARTMEFDADLDSNVIIVPRRLAMHGTAKSGKTGLAWETKYGVTGMNGQGQMIVVDGVNERGLAGGIFYLPSYAQYQDVTADDDSRTLGPWELMTWILTNFATVDEARAALPTIKVADVALTGWPYAPPVHYIVHDANGNSLVVEYIAGQLTLHDNPLGVITNAPDFDWHIKNLNNYVNLSAINVAPVDLAGQKFGAFGQGSGLLGIPGDFTPPSRFVRAVLLSQSALQSANGEEAVGQAFHVLDSFDIPRGTVRGVENGKPALDYTQWTTASDTKNRRFYFHTHDNRRIRRLDLERLDFDETKIVVMSRGDSQDVQDLTPPINEQ
jgi:choloylglycine hydrolase